MQLQDETRDGLRVFSVDSGRATTRATLFFRVGQADETLPTCGWTHLIEHLALHDWNDPRLAFNASVGLFITRFDLDGETDAVLEHLTRLTRWLANPDLSRLEHEAKVLRAESEVRPVGTLISHLALRYGARGPGLRAFRELGLRAARPETVAAWAHTAFTADNAVLAIDRRADDLRLDLPRGTRRVAALPPPALETLPAHHTIPSGLVATAELPRGFATGLLPAVLVHSMTDRFRHGAGAAYAPFADVERVNAETALLSFGSDVSRDGSQTATSELTALLTLLAHQGPPVRLLDDLRVMRSRHLSDPDNAPGVAWAAATADLSGASVLSAEETEEGTSAVTVDDIREVAGAVRQSLLLGVPADGAVPGSIPEATARSATLSAGVREFKHRNGLQEILLGSDGLESISAGGGAVVRFDGVAAMLDYPDGAVIVVSQDGSAIGIEPNLYRRGDVLVGTVRSKVSAELTIPQPERDSSDIPPKRSRLGPLAFWTGTSLKEWLQFGAVLGVSFLYALYRLRG